MDDQIPRNPLTRISVNKVTDLKDPKLSQTKREWLAAAESSTKIDTFFSSIPTGSQPSPHPKPKVVSRRTYATQKLALHNSLRIEWGTPRPEPAPNSRSSVARPTTSSQISAVPKKQQSILGYSSAPVVLGPTKLQLAGPGQRIDTVPVTERVLRQLEKPVDAVQTVEPVARCEKASIPRKRAFDASPTRTKARPAPVDNPVSTKQPLSDTLAHQATPPPSVQSEYSSVPEVQPLPGPSGPTTHDDFKNNIQSKAATSSLVEWFYARPDVLKAPGHIRSFVESILKDALSTEDRSLLLEPSGDGPGSLAEEMVSAVAEFGDQIIMTEGKEYGVLVDDTSLARPSLQSELKCLDAEASAFEWASGLDPSLDALWEAFVIENLSKSYINLAAHLVKPSGATWSPLHIRWHYPTFATKSPFFGTTADSSNPCLNLAMTKLGLVSGTEVFMSEVIYYRYQRKDAKELAPYSNDESLTQCHRRFAESLLGYGKIVLLLGGQNFLLFQKSEMYKRSVGLRLWQGVKIYNQDFHAFAVYENKQKKVVSQLVLLCWHTEGLLRTWSFEHAAHQDDIWNLAVALSGQTIPVKSNYFGAKVAAKAKNIKVLSDGLPAERAEGNPLTRTLDLLIYEKLTNTLITADDLGPCLMNWIRNNSFVANPNSHLSFIKQVHRGLISRSSTWRKGIAPVSRPSSVVGVENSSSKSVAVTPQLSIAPEPQVSANMPFALISSLSPAATMKVRSKQQSSESSIFKELREQGLVTQHLRRMAMKRRDNARALELEMSRSISNGLARDNIAMYKNLLTSQSRPSSICASGRATAQANRRANDFPMLKKANETRRKQIAEGTNTYTYSIAKNQALIDRTDSFFALYNSTPGPDCPETVTRKCNTCGEVVKPDIEPKFYTVRFRVNNLANNYFIRYVYLPTCVMAAAPKHRYLCKACPHNTALKRAVEYVPILGEHVNGRSLPKMDISDWKRCMISERKSAVLLWTGREHLQGLFQSNRVEFNGAIIEWDGARLTKEEHLVDKFDKKYLPSYEEKRALFAETDVSHPSYKELAESLEWCRQRVENTRAEINANAAKGLSERR